MQFSNFYFDGKPIGYEILEDGYNIYLDDKLWITQRVDEYIPYRDVDPNADLETCALKQIEDIVTSAEKAAEEAEIEA